MTYYESYKALSSVLEIKKKMISDTKVAVFLGNNPDRIKAIEDAGNKAIQEMECEQCPYTGNECNAQSCSECDVARETEEYYAQCELAEQYDENGDPYRDFMGNPW